eukprot:753017-Hanusia_phi.AAC.2
MAPGRPGGENLSLHNLPWSFEGNLPVSLPPHVEKQPSPLPLLLAHVTRPQIVVAARLRSVGFRNLREGEIARPWGSMLPLQTLWGTRARRSSQANRSMRMHHTGSRVSIGLNHLHRVPEGGHNSDVIQDVEAISQVSPLLQVAAANVRYRQRIPQRTDILLSLFGLGPDPF